MSTVKRVLSFTAMLALVPLTTGAQPLGKFVFTPYVGVYAPTTDVAQDALSSVEHRAGLALGGTGSYWFTERAGFEVGAAYAWSNLRAIDPAETASKNAGLILGTAKFMYGLFPATSDFQLRLGVGPAIISRMGSAYQSDAEGSITGKTDFGGAVSLCTKIPLGRSLALRLRAEDYMYQAKLGFKDRLDPSDSFTFDERFQHDLILSVGLQIGLPR